MASYSEFARFCSTRTGCDKGGLYAIQPRGLRGSPIKIGYSFNLLRRLAAWEYSYPAGIAILAVARMNRPNETHMAKRRSLQLAEERLKRDLQQHVVSREEWLHPRAKAETLAAMRHLQLSLSPNLAGHFFDAARIKANATILQPPEVRVRTQPMGNSSQEGGTGHLGHDAPWPIPTHVESSQPIPGCHLRRKTVELKCEADPSCRWERRPGGWGKCVAVDGA